MSGFYSIENAVNRFYKKILNNSASDARNLVISKKGLRKALREQLIKEQVLKEKTK